MGTDAGGGEALCYHNENVNPLAQIILLVRCIPALSMAHVAVRAPASFIPMYGEYTDGTTAEE